MYMKYFTCHIPKLIFRHYTKFNMEGVHYISSEALRLKAFFILVDILKICLSIYFISFKTLTDSHRALKVFQLVIFYCLFFNHQFSTLFSQ